MQKYFFHSETRLHYYIVKSKMFCCNLAKNIKKYSLCMKFTKEDAVKGLTAKLSQNVENISKWERTIKENVETLCSILGENSEIELDDFIEKAVPIFNTTAGFIRKENSDLAKTFKTEIDDLKAQLAKPNNQNQVKPTDPNEELLKRLEALENENKRNRDELAQRETKNKLAAKMKELGIKSNKWIEGMLSKAAITADMDVDATAKDYLEIYNDFVANVTPSVTPDNPSGKPTEYANDTIKAAAALAKQNSLVG